tara:strand:+ start:34 stop:423 length:390 start_codon:yes stop_codon:yes gene_type:complete
MIKLRATRKEMKENHYRVIGAGYCELQHLLKYKHPLAYSSGVYGWNCDYYYIYEGYNVLDAKTLIATGYRGVWSRNTTASEKLIREYDDKACRVLSDNTVSQDLEEEIVHQLLVEFIQKAKLCHDISPK